MTLGERYEMGDRMGRRQAEREERKKRESDGAASENGHIADEALERFDAGGMAVEGDLGLRNGLQGTEMVHRGEACTQGSREVEKSMLLIRYVLV
jgi:hypothetical protein